MHILNFILNLYIIIQIIAVKFSNIKDILQKSLSLYTSNLLTHKNKIKANIFIKILFLSKYILQINLMYDTHNFYCSSSLLSCFFKIIVIYKLNMRYMKYKRKNEKERILNYLIRLI